MQDDALVDSDSERRRTPDGTPAQPGRLTAPGVALRPFRDEDASMAMQLANDPYVPLTGTLPAHADAEQAAGVDFAVIPRCARSARSSRDQDVPSGIPFRQI